MRIFKKNIFLFWVFYIFQISDLYSADRPLNIISSINPIYQIVKFISGNQNNNILLIDPNISEHDYSLKPSDIKIINNADVVFYVSTDLEYYLSKALKIKNNPNQKIRLIDLPKLKLLKIKNNIDPHIWLNLDNAVIIAQNIADNLSKLDLKNSKIYQKNLHLFIKQIEIFKKEQGDNLSKIKNGNYFIYHNCYQYFEDFYQIKFWKISDYESRPSLQNIKKINQLIQKENIKCVIVQPQEENKIALEIAKTNKIKLVTADIIGKKNYSNKNGYLEIIKNLISKFDECNI